MSKKASLSLSVNAIVVLILAIVMLSLALGFIKTLFGKTSVQVEAIASKEPEPIPASPGKTFTLSRKTLVLNPSETTAIKFSSYKGATIQNPNLVGYWTFDEGSGATAGDISLRGNTGTLMSGASFVNGKNGEAVNFDGNDDYVSLSQPLPIFNQPFTFTMWIVNDDLGKKLFLGDYDLGGINVNFENDGGGMRLYWGAAPDIHTGTGILPVSPVWTHLALVRDRIDATTSKVYFYRDGVLIYTYNGAFTDKSATIPHRIGRDNRQGDGTPFQGKMDDLQIYNRALSAEEIKNIAQGNLIAVGKGCIADTTPTQTQPLKIISQVSKNIANGESATSQFLIKAHNSPVDTVCQICATPLGGGGCVDMRVIVK